MKKLFTRISFTIVELLVVISIILILISILLPALRKTRETTKRINCISNMGRLTQGLLMYPNDYNSWLPFAMDLSYGHGYWSFSYPKTYIYSSSWQNPLWEYIGNSNVFHELKWCPTSKNVQFSNSTDTGKRDYSGFLINGNLCGVHGTSKPLQKINRISLPSHSFILVDQEEKSGPTDIVTTLYYRAYYWQALVLSENYNKTGYHHLGKANFTYIDGHSDTLKWQEVNQQKAEGLLGSNQ